MLKEEKKTFQRIYKGCLLYLPFIQVNCVILFIYAIYVKYYIMIFIRDQWTLSDSKNVYSKNNNQTGVPQYHYIIYSVIPGKVTQYGMILLLTFTWMTFWLMVSFHRTCYSNPGYLPNPMEFEIKLLYSIINKPHFYSSIVAGSPKENKFITAFDYIADNGPLTQKEVIRLNKAMNSCIAMNDSLDNKCFLRNAIRDFQLMNNSMNSFNPQVDRDRNVISSNCNSGLDIEMNTDANSNSNPKPNAYEIVDVNSLTLCANCTRWKPERTHHCRYCNKCVLKMDHHCPWLANCIGFYNYKSFLLIILYAFISSSMVLFTFWEVIIEVMMSNEASLTKCVLCSFAYLCNAILFAFIAFLFWTNGRNVVYNITTIERSDQMRFGNSISNGYKKKRSDIIYKYNKEIYSNLVDVFGRNPLIWFLPIYSDLKGEGIIFD